MSGIGVGSREGAGARWRARLGLSALLIALAAPTASDEIKDDVDAVDCGCCVIATLHAAVPPAVAWEVLTDYDHIERFVRSMVSSRAERQSDGRLLVHQVATGRLFTFPRRVQIVLEIHEEPSRRILFHDVLGKDFSSYSGEWSIAPDSTGTRVEYRLMAEPRAAMARLFCRGMLHRTAEELLAQVRAEMVRRATGK